MMQDVPVFPAVIAIDLNNIIDDTAFPAIRQFHMGNRDNNIYGFADEFLQITGSIRIFLRQRFDTCKSFLCPIGMHSTGSAFMPGIPGFEHRIGCPVPDLTYNDTVW